MGPAATAQSSEGLASSIPTAQDVTTAGGVWAPTSAKRDKLSELQTALEGDEQRTLDDAATPEQRYDLWLCDGMAAIAATADSNTLSHQKENNDNNNNKLVNELNEWWDSKIPDPNLAQIQFENMMQWFGKEIDRHLAMSLPVDQTLRDVRDYYNINSLNSHNPKYNLPIPGPDDVIALQRSSESTAQQQRQQFEQAVLRYRLLLAKAAAQTLQSSWAALTKVSDQDVDRAAVSGQDPSTLKVSTLSADKVKAVVLTAFLQGNAADRTNALWRLMDRDEDDRLDELEMNQVCEWSIAPVRTALETLWSDAMEASLVRPPPPPAGSSYEQEPPPLVLPSLSWRQRRRERGEKRRLTKTFAKTLQRHFVEEVEQPHRLRCIYAWANKAHQNNKIESVLVEKDESFGGVRKRYVELSPKISLPEFREVQQEHFTHLDRVGAEYVKSLREDLWVAQGNGRLSRELYRDCAIFMTVVCVVDYIIVVL